MWTNSIDFADKEVKESQTLEDVTYGSSLNSIIIQLLPPTFHSLLPLHLRRGLTDCVWREILATEPPPQLSLSSCSPRSTRSSVVAVGPNVFGTTDGLVS